MKPSRDPTWRTQVSESQTDTQPCGHPRSAIVSSDEGTSYCGTCEEEASLGTSFWRSHPETLLRAVQRDLREFATTRPTMPWVRAIENRIAALDDLLTALREADEALEWAVDEANLTIDSYEEWVTPEQMEPYRARARALERLRELIHG